MKFANVHIDIKRLSALFVVALLGISSLSAASVNFYGHIIDFKDHNLSQASLAKVSKAYLDRFDRYTKQSTIEEMSSELKYKQVAYNLDDIGMLKMLDQRLESTYRDHNRRTFLKFRVLQHLKYDVLLTYSGNVLDCFGTMNFKPLENVYIIRNKKRYNNLNFSDKRTYGNRYIYNNTSSSGRKLRFDSRKRPKIFKNKRSREISFKYNQVAYKISAEGNGSLMDYYNDLPAIDFSKSYIHSGFSDQAQSTVIHELKEITSKMSKRQSIGFLLKFVQSSFPYKTDYENHGREKYNFPEETLFAKFSDCEDRSLLLAGLVKEILGLNSVALYFEKDQHMSLAIEMSEYNYGYSFKYDNRFFVACEPTGRNYRFGQSAIDLERITQVYKLY
jgi:hypothetical protein